mmetsp:Transcript_4436/g.10439  ORF Transcript_4436/g.10439 Transcript_4436/m.10439 type:complete len:227 (-) Transcript_4436:200-880(-)
MAITVGVSLVAYVLVTTGIPAGLHYFEHGVIVPLHIAMSFFLTLNILICFWEIVLGMYIRQIKSEYLKLKEKYEKKPMDAVVKFFMAPVSMNDIMNPKYWTKVWSTYSLYDPSYQNHESFGFFIDVGNGWTTIFPSMLWLICMTYHNIVSARIIGFIGIAKFWQELYGTCIYALSFFFNNRQKGRTIGEVVLFVGLSNGLWFVFPLLGIYASWDMINTNTFHAFQA